MTHRPHKDRSHLLFPFFAFLFLMGATLLGLEQSQTRQNDQSRADVETSTQPESPAGQVISLDFRIPEIGSRSGNLNPLHKERSVVLHFFDPDKNSTDPSVKPLATYNSNATYDSNTNSPTFGSFVNQKIDLGDKVPDGEYQIVLKTDQSIQRLIKEKTTDVGGIVFEIKKSFGQNIIIQNQTIILGDIFPSPKGDNAINADDFNVLISCFGTKADTPSCKDKRAADLNDDGIINGTDYNIMSNSAKVLSEQGLAAPTPSGPVATKSPTKTNPTPANTQQKTSNAGTGIALVIVLILILAVAIGIFLFLKKRKNKTELEQEDNIDGEYYVKSHAYDDINKREVLTLTNDNGPILGYYAGEKVSEGFAKVKGVLKKDKDKEYIEISKITPEVASS